MALNINGTTGISGVDGSSSAPALTGTDSNTGINFASDVIDLNTGGSSRFKVGAAGQLGVAGANYGTSGQALVSQGASAAPQWATVGGGGITVAQQFRQTTFTASNNETIIFDSNWEKTDDSAAGSLGSFNLPTSGVFTFPSTGIYYVTFSSYFEDSGYNSNAQIQIQATTDGSSFDTFSATHFGTNYNQSGNNYASGFVNAIIDVTNTNDIKVRFRAYSNSTVSWDGSSAINRTYATFIRLGDT